MQCPRCQQDNPSHALFCLKCGTPLQRPDGSSQLAPSYAHLRRSLTELLEQQTATSEILRAINAAQTDPQLVFDAIAPNAVRLCGALRCHVFRFDGTLIHIAADYNLQPEAEEYFRRAFPSPLTSDGVLSAAIRERRVVQHDNAQTNPAVPVNFRETAKRLGYQAVMAVPMLHDDTVIGAIGVSRLEPHPFSEQQIELVKTFADQAVIAIENVRLFKELEARNRDLTTALDRQTATSEILRVISSSPTNVQPVFDAIAENARRLCAGVFSAVLRYDGELLHLEAHNMPPEAAEAYRAVFPMGPSRGSAGGRAVLDCAVAHIPDVEADPEWGGLVREGARRLGYRSILAVPMLRDGQVVGTINVARRDPESFSGTQIDLLKTFADQAVIAIENVRLFKELEARNRDLTETLEQQTATGDILRVISSSPTDIQPVFDAIIRSAVTLCDASFGGLHLFDGEQITLDAHGGNIPEEEVEFLRARVFPYPPRPNSLVGEGSTFTFTIPVRCGE
jgi:two-component system NtrC family sensor kinase